MQVSEQTAPKRWSFSTRLHLHPRFHSRFLPDDRDVTVYLPPHYDENVDREYPVLYVQDGQNLFESETAFESGRTWQFAESVDAAILAGEVEPLIVVGIANAGERRLAEYTPTSDWKLGGGQADKYGRLLTEELLPFIEARYRVRPGAANTRVWAGRPLEGWLLFVWACSLRRFSGNWPFSRLRYGGIIGRF